LTFFPLSGLARCVAFEATRSFSLCIILTLSLHSPLHHPQKNKSRSNRLFRRLPAFFREQPCLIVRFLSLAFHPVSVLTSLLADPPQRFLSCLLPPSTSSLLASLPHPFCRTTLVDGGEAVQHIFLSLLFSTVINGCDGENRVRTSRRKIGKYDKVGEVTMQLDAFRKSSHTSMLLCAFLSRRNAPLALALAAFTLRASFLPRPQHLTPSAKLKGVAKDDES
jgi:hypothetical protein